jgi:large subunit ribosomal protein L17
MRHKVAGHKLGRSKGELKALQRIMINQFFTHERIRTTRAKAEFIRGQAERMITLAKNSSDVEESAKVHARRLVAARLGNPVVVKKLFDEIAPRFDERVGGFTRIIKLGPRHGDAAEMVLLELTEE